MNESRNDEIKALVAAGKSYAEVGRQFGITRQRVEQIAGIPGRQRQRHEHNAMRYVCPDCGGEKRPQSEHCRACFNAEKIKRTADKHQARTCERCGRPPSKAGSLAARRITMGLCNSCRSTWYSWGRKQFDTIEAYIASKPKRMWRNK